MKKYLLALLLFASTSVFADRVDTLNMQPTREFCTQVTYMFYDGMIHRFYNHPLEFKNIPQSEVYPDVSEPSDGIYMIDWDAYTDQEKEFVVKYYSEGWNLVNSTIAQGVKVNPGSFERITDEYFEVCKAEKDKQKRM